MASVIFFKSFCIVGAVDAVLQEHGRRGRRLVDVAVRDKFLTDLLYSFRRQHVIRDQTQYLMVNVVVVRDNVWPYIV